VDKVDEVSVGKASVGGAAVGGALVSNVQLNGSTRDGCSPCAWESSRDPPVAAGALPLPRPRPREVRGALGAIVAGDEKVLN
jgi:hypothetical protein